MTGCMGYIFSRKYRQDKSVLRETKRRLRRGRNFIQADRRNIHGRDSGDVAYRNEQGNCINSFQK